MDFTKETQIAIAKVIEEKMPEMIALRTENMIQDIVKDIFSYGDVRKNIKKKIEESINVNLQEFDLIDYNVLIANTINGNLVKQINMDPIIEMTKEITGFVNKKQITLQEIADFVIEASQQENESEGEGEITFNVDYKDDYIVVSLDLEPKTNRESCTVELCISQKTERIFMFRNKRDYWDSSLKKITPMRLTKLDQIEHKLFRLYAAGVKVTDLNDDPNIYWDRY